MVEVAMAWAGRGAYRRLLRASRELFAGDARALVESRAELRRQFAQHRDVTDAAEVSELVKDALEAEDMMRTNLVQARLNQRGNFEVDLKPVEADEGSTCPPKFEPRPVDAAEVARQEEELRLRQEKDKQQR